jgi:uncharacterized protein (TIGR02597 family)
VTKALLPPAVFYSTKPKSNRKSYLVMKPIISFALLGALFAVGAANAAVTDPVGYVTLGDTTVGQPSIKANTDVYISIPLLKSSVFAGQVASVAGNVITISGTPALGSLATPAAPHVVVIENGTKSGLIGLITANDASTITVAAQPNDNLTGIVAGDALSIRPSWTVKGLLGTGLPSGTQLLGFSGSFAGVNPSADLVYEYDGTNWIDVVSFDVADNVVIYPNETFIVRNVSANPINSLVVVGDVPTANSRTIVTNTAGSGQDNVLTFFGAVDEVIGTSGLSAVAQAGDQVFAFNNNAAGLNKSSAQVVEYDGTSWIDVVSFDDVTTTFKFEAGKGYVVRRLPTSALPPTVWTNVPDYVPGL